MSIINNIEYEDKYCYICLEKINYYIKYECGCYNYIHNNCNININNCLLLKKLLKK